MGLYSNNKDINKEVTFLIRNGWRVENRSKHKLIVSPNGGMTGIPGSPRCNYSVNNFRRDIKRIMEKSG
jgi:hypothetical protein